MEDHHHAPNLKLLALLEKMAAPVSSCKVTMDVVGVFAFPDDWKVPDGQNPAESIFCYKLSFLGAEASEGQFVPRMLTEEEKKAAEEAAAAKKKPAAPKDKKSKEELTQVTSEDADKQKRLEEERAEHRRRTEEEWNRLDEQTKFYRTQEDPYKCPAIKWDKNPSISISKEGEDLVQIEELVESGGQWINLTRYINVPEDKLAQLKKQPPKGINKLDLNPVHMKGFIDLKEFQKPGLKSAVLRAKLQQYYTADQTNPNDFPKPNLENTYACIKLTFEPPITPLVTDIQPTMADLIPKPQPIPKMPPSVEVINEYKSQLVVAMESLAMEYTSMFAKETNSDKDPKGKLLSNQQRKDQREQRKEKFLFDFNVSGKYNILKEKLKKSIMKIVRDKFQKTGSLTGVTTDSRDQFYSELYIFLVEQMRQTLNDLVQNKKDELHEDLVVSQEHSSKERDKLIFALTKESNSDKCLRLAIENEIIYNLIESEKAFKNLLNIDKANSKNWFAFCTYLLRRKNFQKAEEALIEALTYEPDNTDYILLLAVLQTRRDRRKEPILCLESILEKNYNNSLANTLMSFIYSKYLNEPKLGRKYFAVSQRIWMRKLDMLPPRQVNKSGVDAPEGFNVRYTQQTHDLNQINKVVLPPEKVDDIWVELIQYLLKYEIVDFAEKVMGNLNDKNSARARYFLAQIEFMKGDMEKSIETLNEMIKVEPKNTEYLLTKANYCFIANDDYEAEETFLKAFKLKANVKNFQTYLRLGYIFLRRKAWGDARAVLTKASEMKPNSSISWLGLGIL